MWRVRSALDEYLSSLTRASVALEERAEQTTKVRDQQRGRLEHPCRVLAVRCPTGESAIIRERSTYSNRYALNELRMSFARDDYEDTFQELFGIAFSSALRIVGHREDAEDIALETMTRAYIRWPLIRSRSRPWVSAVAFRLGVDAWRRRVRQSKYVPDMASTELEAAGIDRLMVAEALRQLPHRQRQVMVLRYFGALSEKEIATVLNCSPGSVKRHASRALTHLRGTLSDDVLPEVSE